MARVEWQRVQARRYRILEHEGAWTDSLKDTFAAEECTGLHWSVKRARRAVPALGRAGLASGGALDSKTPPIFRPAALPPGACQ